MQKYIRFSEQFAITDLAKNAVSDLTADFLFDREHGEGTNKLDVFEVQVRGDKLYIHYRMYPTYSADAVRIATNGKEISTTYYDTLFEIANVKENLGDASTFDQFSQVERASVLRDFLEHGMTRVWCNCAGFHAQGMWEDLASVDAVVFPFPGPKGNGIWRARHAKGLKNPEIRICKHIASAIHHMFKRDVTTILKAIKLPAGEPTPVQIEQPLPVAEEQKNAAPDVPVQPLVDDASEEELT